MRVTFRPLGHDWQGEPTRGRSRSQLRPSFGQTMQDLEYELEQLGAHSVVVQIDVSEDDIRLDGWPRSNARPTWPAVAISFESTHGPLRYATDRFPHWHENLRAIALGLKALRAVDRYGITRSGEQYTGWRQLTAGTGPTSKDEAASVLASFSEFTAEQVWDYPTEAYRQALKRTHPDAGGDSDLFVTVREAGRLLGVAS